MCSLRLCQGSVSSMQFPLSSACLILSPIPGCSPLHYRILCTVSITHELLCAVIDSSVVTLCQLAVSIPRQILIVGFMPQCLLSGPACGGNQHSLNSVVLRNCWDGLF